jgi:hypothetical protein
MSLAALFAATLRLFLDIGLIPMISSRSALSSMHDMAGLAATHKPMLNDAAAPCQAPACASQQNLIATTFQ